jgi:lysophospholipase L1-like esterase
MRNPVAKSHAASSLLRRCKVRIRTTFPLVAAGILALYSQRCDADEPAGERSVRRVACIGDSITCGHGLKDPKREAYPAQLQKLLGRDYEVRPFCMSGVTLLKGGAKSIWATDEWKLAQQYGADVVIVQLGTNDTKEADWRRHQNEFLDDYESLIRAIRKANPAVDLFICLPPPLFRDRGKPWDTDAVLVKEIVPKIRRVAADEKATLIDVYSVCDAHASDFPDGVHPNAAASKVIAQTISAAVDARHPETKSNQTSDVR